MEYLKWASENYMDVLNATQALFAGVIAVSLLIPGEQPEKFLKNAVKFLSKFSKK